MMPWDTLPDIPERLRRDANNRAPFMDTVHVSEIGHWPIKQEQETFPWTTEQK